MAVVVELAHVTLRKSVVEHLVPGGADAVARFAGAAAAMFALIALTGCHDRQGATSPGPVVNLSGAPVESSPSDPPASSPGGRPASCPSGLGAAQSIALTGGAPEANVKEMTSADALKSAAERFVAPPDAAQASGGRAASEPTVNESARLDTFVRETDFTVNDVAVVRAGGKRNYIAGVEAGAGKTRIFFSSACALCGGGDPGSYYAAKARYDASVNPWTALVRVKKGSPVSVETCTSGPCGECGPRP